MWGGVPQFHPRFISLGLQTTTSNRLPDSLTQTLKRRLAFPHKPTLKLLFKPFLHAGQASVCPTHDYLHSAQDSARDRASGPNEHVLSG